MASFSKDNGGWLFVQAGVISGLGVGLLKDDVAPYMFIGLGVGFLLFALASVKAERKD